MTVDGRTSRLLREQVEVIEVNKIGEDSTDGQKSDCCIVVKKPMKVGGAKAAASSRICCGNSTMPHEGSKNGKRSGRVKV